MDQFRIFRNSNHFILWNKGKFRYSNSLICEFELFPFMGLCFSELLPRPQTFFLLVFTKMKQVRKIPSGVRVSNCGFEIQMKFRFHIVLLASDNCKFNFFKNISRNSGSTAIMCLPLVSQHSARGISLWIRCGIRCGFTRLRLVMKPQQL